MRFKGHCFVKRLLTTLGVVMVAFSFHATLISSPQEPKSTKLRSRGYETTTETFRGLYTATLKTPRGKINVNLPADMAAGDTISGTVYQAPVGNTDEERARNLGELNGIVVEVEEIKDKRTPANQKRDSWFIPTAINAMHLVFKDNDGIEIGRTVVPVSPEPPVSPHSEFQLPGIGQSGNSLHIPGPFDGDFGSTSVRIGGFNAEPLAESPRGLIILTPHQVTGRTNILLTEGNVDVSGEYRNVSVHIAANQLRLQSGETTTLSITAKGLDRLEDEVPLRLKNKSPEAISMEGGNNQTHIIRPENINSSGIYTLIRILTGKLPGTFSISAKIYPEKKGGEFNKKHFQKINNILSRQNEMLTQLINDYKENKIKDWELKRDVGKLILLKYDILELFPKVSGRRFVEWYRKFDEMDRTLDEMREKKRYDSSDIDTLWRLKWELINMFGNIKIGKKTLSFHFWYSSFSNMDFHLDGARWDKKIEDIIKHLEDAQKKKDEIEKEIPKVWY